MNIPPVVNFIRSASLSFLKAQIFIFPVLSVVQAGRIAWTCDDAFISFRYALNLSRGYGLVFNRGEHVEGMTNFLWTVILSPFLIMGADAEKASSLLGIFFYAMLFVSLLSIGRKIIPEFREKKPRAVRGGYFLNFDFLRYPVLTVLSLSVHVHMQVFATSGLETSFFIFLSTTGLLLVSLRLDDAKKSSGEGLGFSGRDIPGMPRIDPGALGLFFITLSSLARPDGLLFYGVSSLFLLHSYIEKRRRENVPPGRAAIFLHAVRDLAVSHSGFILTFIPVTVFRYLYYGSIVPNTFYAKSALDPYFGQGMHYLYLYFKSYHALVMLALVALILYGFLRFSKREDAPGIAAFDRISLFFAAVIALWLLYVLQVGGDFMFARFVLPVTPLMYLFLERIIRSFLSKNFSVSAYAAVVVLSVSFTLLRFDPFRGGRVPVIESITDEFRVYTPERRVKYREFSFFLKKALRGLDPVIAFKGGLAGMIYYLDVSTAIESTTGLTDRYIASQKLAARGRIGHEKSAPLDYLMSRDVVFILGTIPGDRDFGYNSMTIEGYPGKIEILQWKPEIMDVLKKYPEFKFADFPSYLDGLDRRGSVSSAQLEEFKKYYFNHVSDERRLRIVEGLVMHR